MVLDRILTRTQLLELIDELALSRQIIGPVRRSAHHFYERVERGSQLDLEFKFCVYSPKAVLFPAQETLFTYQKTPNSFETRPIYDESLTALVGVHPCDLHAIRLLDHVFANTHRDEHYLTRRHRTFIVGVDCPIPCTEGVFCGDMKANAASDGFDIMCYPLGSPRDGDLRYGVMYGTKAGREFILYAQAGDPPTVEDERAFRAYQKQKDAAFPRAIPYDVDTLPDLLARSYDSLLWEATARRCYSCGSCNLSCPTCYCFNTYDEADLSLARGERRREWDGCQLRDFALVAGDHNFRPEAASRLRHRIYRKAKWIKEREGVAGCVGCARCDRACTAKISAVELYNQLAEES